MSKKIGKSKKTQIIEEKRVANRKRLHKIVEKITSNILVIVIRID